MKSKTILSIVFLFSTVKVWGMTRYSQEDVAKHSAPQDCWIIIEGDVYGLSKYLPDHEKYTKALPDFCGKDGTQAWKTKLKKQKPHSKKAALILKKYKIGELEK